MIRSRLIPILLIDDNSLVKTKRFKFYKYLGDPLNTVRIFNEKNVDELMILNISSAENKKILNKKLLKEIANQCRMPICYGGGIKDINTVREIIELGIEKIGFGASAFKNPDLIEESIDLVGSQSIVIFLDYKVPKFKKSNYCFIDRGKKNTGITLEDAVEKFINIGVGEIVLQSINRDGSRKGYDLNSCRKILEKKKIVYSIAGGAGKIEDCIEVDKEFGPVGIAASSLFVFSGPYDAVLITYPNKLEKINYFA